jgi:two-component system, cell cycle sensor histidine kinase and response regulator CckA
MSALNGLPENPSIDVGIERGCLPYLESMRNCPIALIVGGDRQVRQLIAARLSELGCATCDAVSQEEAFEQAARTSVDVVVVDVCQTQAAGYAAIRKLRAGQPNLKVLYLIGPREPVLEKAPTAMARDAYLRKPFHLDELCDIVSSWLQRPALPIVTSASVH